MIVAVLLLVGIVVLTCWEPARAKERRIVREELEACADFRWAPAPFGPDHQSLASHVWRYVALGYTVHSHIARPVGGQPAGGTVLVHPDGSVVDLWASAPEPVASVASLLDGGLVLETMEKGPIYSTPERLVQMTDGTGPEVLVGAHRAAVAWLADRGIGVVIDPGGPGSLMERSAHAIGRLLGEDPAVCLHNLRSSEARHGRPLWEQDGIEAVVAQARGGPG